MTDKENFKSLLNDAAKERLANMEVRTQYGICNGKNVVTFHLCESEDAIDRYCEMINNPFADNPRLHVNNITERLQNVFFGE